MQRKVVSLNGTWVVAFDESNVGKRRKFFQKFPRGRPIAVPSVWEQVRPDYDGVGWYRRTFTAEARWRRQCVRLRFGAVNYFCEVYLNGKSVGRHEGGYTPFEFDVTSKLAAGENVLVVRVINPPRRKVIEGFRSGGPLNASEIPAWKAGWYWNFGGIWQSVELIITPRAFIEDVFVEPLPDARTAKVHVTLAAKAPATGRLAVDVGPWKGTADTGGDAAKRVALKRGSRVITLPLKLRNMRWWDTEDPFLYVARVNLTTDAGADETTVRFGMRTFTVKNGHFALNGRRIALKGVLHQGAYPRTIAFPHAPAILRRELELVKKGGMNFVRLHIKPDPFTPLLADELGLLLVAEPPCGWIKNSPQITRRCLHEVAGLVKRDRNHPSIIMWCMLNEIYHYWTFTPCELDRLRYKMSCLARGLDPTRIIGDNSGGAHEYEQCAGAFMPYKKTYAPLQDLHHYCRLPLTPETLQERYRQWHRRGPFYISEFGAWECPPDYVRTLARYSAADKRIGLEDYVQYRSFWDSFREKFAQAGLKDVFGDPRRMIRQNDAKCAEEVRAVVSAMRANPDLDAYAICQLADASGEIFGLTDIWRQPKLHFKDFAAAAQTPWIVPHLPRRVIEPGARLPLVLDGVNENVVGRKYRAEVTIRPQQGGAALARAAATFTARGWAQKVLETSLPGPKRGGRYLVEAVLKEQGRLLCRNTLRFTVVEPRALDGQIVSVVGGSELAEAVKLLGAKPRPASNSAAQKTFPFLVLAKGLQDGGPSFETVQQISRQVRLGGAAILLEPATPLYYDSLLPRVIRQMSPMRSIGYARPHPIFEGLPTGIVEYDYSRLLPAVHHSAEDVKKAGGRTIMGSLWAHMWTRPDVYVWTSIVDEVPLGRGKVILVRLRLLEHLKSDPVARRLLANVIRYAAASIRPGLEERCVGRCFDPITAPE